MATIKNRAVAIVNPSKSPRNWKVYTITDPVAASSLFGVLGDFFEPVPEGTAVAKPEQEARLWMIDLKTLELYRGRPEPDAAAVRRVLVDGAGAQFRNVKRCYLQELKEMWEDALRGNRLSREEPPDPLHEMRQRMLDGVPPRVIDPVDGARFATAVDFARHLVPEAPWREFPGEFTVAQGEALQERISRRSAEWANPPGEVQVALPDNFHDVKLLLKWAAVLLSGSETPSVEARAGALRAVALATQGLRARLTAAP